MKSLKKIIALSTGSAAMFASSLSALPANATTVPGCGEEPTGATLTKLGSHCEIDFKSAGSFNYTIPSGATGLAALIVGAGSGAYVDQSTTGYAGSGGKVKYLDLSATTSGTSLAITVGDGSASNANPLNGADSSVTVGLQTTSASGGVPTTQFYCYALRAGSTYVGAGPGASGNPVYSEGDFSGSYCNPVSETGINPSTSQIDSYGNTRPAIFDSYSSFLGRGGKVLEHPTVLNSDASLIATGNGADVYVATATTVPQWNSKGGSGRVIFRFNAFATPTVSPTPTPTPSASTYLAETGSNAGVSGSIALILSLSGLGLLIGSSRARKTAK